MPFIPHTQADTDAMLKAIGAGGIDDLFAEIPAELKLEALEGIPPAIGESEAGRLMRRRAARDEVALNFLGAGAYEHHIPAAVWELTTRGEFYSAYTPYQAEGQPGHPAGHLRIPDHDGEPDGARGLQRVALRRRVRPGRGGAHGGEVQPRVQIQARAGSPRPASPLPGRA